ncbi:MAG: hypothetical protein ACOCV1_00835 [Bacillota bacterium]
MKPFSEWDKELKKEGTNPTDIDSAGNDQDLDNTGVPYDLDAAEQIALKTKEQEESDREYQKKIYDLMRKSSEKESDPTKGPEGETKGGMVNKAIKKYLTDQVEKDNKFKKDRDKTREDIPVKITSTYFRQSQQPPRFDARAENGNADKHGPIIDKER